jgi:arylsulfatase A
MKSTRREFLQYTGLLTTQLALAGCSCLSSGKTPSKNKPNVIYILADDLGYGDLSCYGQKRFETPNIDRLAAEGMRFTQHYSGSTVCAPSRCSLMTGLHTGHTQVRGNQEIKPEGQFPLAAGTFTLPTLFKKAGYVTGAFGKWGLGGPDSDGAPNKQGFDQFFGYNCQREAHFFYPKHLWRNEQKVELPDNDPTAQKGVYAHDLIVDEAFGFVRKNKDKSFFMYMPITIPHAELAIPQKDMEAFKGKYPETPFPGEHYGAQPTPHAAFAAMVTKLDTNVGQLVSLLKELGLDDKTVVMFTSDNGPHKEGGADPDFFDSNGPLRGYKRDVYEGGIRVPMIARWPEKIKAGSKSELISAFWDVLPTCAELTGQALPEKIDGISLVPTLLGDRAKQKQHAYLYWEFHELGGRQAVRMGNWKAVRMNVLKTPDAPIELYDLSQDIAEVNNVAAGHPDVVRKMKAILAEARVPNSNFPFLTETPRKKNNQAG